MKTAEHLKHPLLVFDTETSGLVNYKRSVNDPCQPRICQFAMACYPPGIKNPSFVMSTLIKPEGWTISTEATKIHGITNEMCHDMGVTMSWLLNMFNRWFEKDILLVGHNIDFDIRMINCEYSHKYGVTSSIPQKKTFCTMKAMTPICALPPNYAGADFKWPKLEEAYQHCFGKKFDGAHDALNDLKATKDIFDWIPITASTP